MTKDEHAQHDSATEKAITETVQRHGWFVCLFMGSRYLPSFAYTIGLWKTFRHPELICLGLTTETLHSVLNLAGEKVRKGEVIAPGQLYDDIFDGSVAGFVGVDNANLKDYMGYGMWFNEYKPFEALQLVWTDRHGRFPWRENFEEEFRFRQPVLDKQLDFKFYADTSQAVVTCRQHLELNRPITSVLHEENGDWQFLTDDDLAETDIRWVALGALIVRDPTLNTLFDLDEGHRATKDAAGRWTRTKITSA